MRKLNNTELMTVTGGSLTGLETVLLSGIAGGFLGSIAAAEIFSSGRKGQYLDMSGLGGLVIGGPFGFCTGMGYGMIANSLGYSTGAGALAASGLAMLTTGAFISAIQ